LDTLKTRVQSSSFHQTYRSTAAIADRALWRGLYQGVGSVLLVAVPSAGVFFTSYEGLKYLLGSGWLPQPGVHMLSSLIAQTINCAVVTPAEVLKQNAQMVTTHRVASRTTPPYRHLGSSPTMQIMRQLGRTPTKLWSGYSAMCIRDLPFTALQFPAFEYLKTVLTARRSRLKKGGGPVTGVLERAWISAISAAIAGTAAAGVTTPFDVVKTKMMLDAGMEAAPECEASARRLRNGGHVQQTTRSRRSAYAIGKSVLHNEGVRGLFRGGLMRTGSTMFGNGLYMGCYEGARFYLQASQ
jgi:solute carrier family 25 (mitochondrial S-adenosylmethionine transporter), member 26